MMPSSGGGMGGQGQGMYMNLNGGDRDNYAPSSVPSQVRKTTTINLLERKVGSSLKKNIQDGNCFWLILMIID